MLLLVLLLLLLLWLLHLGAARRLRARRAHRRRVGSCSTVVLHVALLLRVLVALRVHRRSLRMRAGSARGGYTAATAWYLRARRPVEVRRSGSHVRLRAGRAQVDVVGLPLRGVRVGGLLAGVLLGRVRARARLWSVLRLRRLRVVLLVLLLRVLRVLIRRCAGARGVRLARAVRARRVHAGILRRIHHGSSLLLLRLAGHCTAAVLAAMLRLDDGTSLVLLPARHASKRIVLGLLLRMSMEVRSAVAHRRRQRVRVVAPMPGARSRRHFGPPVAGPRYVDVMRVAVRRLSAWYIYMCVS